MPKRKFIDIELREDERALETVAAASDSKGVDGSRGKTDKSDSVATDILFRRPGRLERIVGTDDRVRILNTEDYPFRMICKLTMQFPHDPNIYAGSGALIGPNIVLTCAHNVFEAGKGNAHTISCASGQADYNQTPFGEYKVKRILFPDEYKTSNLTKNDYAAIILDGSPGDDVGWFGYAAASDTRLRNSKLNLTGYPGDKGGVQLWHHSSHPLEFDEHTMKYTADTFGGNSGGPIYSYYKDDPWPIIYGIHTYGATAWIENGKVIIPEHNGGRRLDFECLEDIAEWRKIAESMLPNC